MSDIHFGVIESRQDPLRLGRYKVRVVSLHTSNAQMLKTEDLPWAIPLQFNSAAISGIGTSPTGYVEGTTVAVTFADESQQVPIILGSIAGIIGENKIEPEKFTAINTEVALIPADAPGEPKPVKNAAGKLEIVEPPYIGKLTGPDVRKILIPFIAKLRGFQYTSDMWPYALGKYGFTPSNLADLGYIDTDVFIGKNGISSKESLLETKNYLQQDDIEEVLLKQYFTAAVKAGILSTESPKEKVAGILVACHVAGVEGAYKYVAQSNDTVNELNETVSTFYQQGYKKFAGVDTNEKPTEDNVASEASDKQVQRTKSPTASVYDIPTDDQSKQPGFTDPYGKYPLKDRLNEPDLPRLATNLKISQSAIGKIEALRTKSIPLCGGKTWDQPLPSFNPIYPFNHATVTESGHVLEFDDTKDNERIHLFHKTGNFFEIDAKGNFNERVMGTRTIIVDKDDLLHVKGSGHISVTEAVTIRAGQGCYIEVVGDANIKTSGNMNLEAGGSINMKANGNVNIDGAQVHINDGAAASTSSYAGTVTFDTPVNRQDTNAITVENTPTATLLANGISLPPTKTEVIDVPEQKPTDVKGVEVSKVVALPLKYGTKLSTNYTLGDLVKESGREFPFEKSQNGLTDVKLAENLKRVAVNCLEPILKQFPYMTINSGFRLNGAVSESKTTSDHNVGCAIDMSFKRNAKLSYDAVLWIHENVPYSQLLLEYDLNGSVWVHVAYKPGYKSAIPYGTFWRHSLKFNKAFVLLDKNGNVVA